MKSTPAAGFPSPCISVFTVRDPDYRIIRGLSPVRMIHRLVHHDPEVGVAGSRARGGPDPDKYVGTGSTGEVDPRSGS